jgi:hypothetical protein
MRIRPVDGRSMAAIKFDLFASGGSAELRPDGGPQDMTKHPVDVALVAAALWLLCTEIIDILTPKELTGVMIATALAPPVFVGVAIYSVNFYRRNRRRV